jgi:hypothetical protein
LYILVFSLVVYVSNYFFNFMSAYIVIFWMYSILSFFGWVKSWRK